MSMELVTKESLAATVAERWRKQYEKGDSWHAFALPCREPLAKDVYELLLKATTADEMDEIIGNKSWTRVVCTGCLEQVQEAIIIRTETFCFTCIDKMHTMRRSHGQT